MTTPPRGDDPEDGPPDHPRPADGPESGYQLPPAYLPPPGDPYGPPPPPGRPSDPYLGPPQPYGPYRGPAQPPGYPYQQWRPQQPESRISIGMVFAGCGVWAVINVVVALVAILASAGATSGSDNVILGVGALGLVLIAFGVGGGLLATSNRYAKGFGLGLMIGWALVSLFTVGFCTGINPGMYTL